MTAILVAAAGGALGLAGSGNANASGVWTRVSDPDGTNGDEVAVARTADGVLHVLWRRHVPGGNDLRHAPIRPDGRLGRSTDVVRRWSAVGNPYLLRTAEGGLLAFFGGIRSSDVRDPVSVNAATAPAAGDVWTLQPMSAGGKRLQVSDVGGAIGKDGTPISVWADTAPGSNGWHFGTDGAEPDGKMQDRCCVLAPDAAVDRRSGQAIVVWHSTAAGSRGIFAQSVEGVRAVGPKRLAPGSVTGGNAVAPTQRLGVVEREGGGVYVAYGSGYPSFERVVLWRYGAARPTVSLPADRAQHVNVGPGPEGRLWLMWEQGGTLFFSRSNRAATRLGRIVSAKPPAGTTRIWRLQGEGSRAQPLDVLAHVTTGSATATWHTQVLPGLQLAARVTRDGVAVTVHEAGDPVSSATVTAGGRRGVTSKEGLVQLVLPAGTHVVKASKAGYAPAELRIRIP